METVSLTVLVVAFVSYTASVFILASDKKDDKPGRVLTYAAAIALLISTVIIFAAWIYSATTNR